MMAIFTLVLSISVLSASPIQKEVDSVKRLSDLAASIVAQKGKNVISFKVTWKPKVTDKHFPPRLDLFLGDHKVGHARLQIRYAMNDKGVCYADFTLRLDQLAKAQLKFRGSQQFEYTLDLSDYMDGFKRFKVTDPFSK